MVQKTHRIATNFHSTYSAAHASAAAAQPSHADPTSSGSKRERAAAGAAVDALTPELERARKVRKVLAAVSCSEELSGREALQAHRRLTELWESWSA